MTEQKLLAPSPSPMVESRKTSSVKNVTPPSQHEKSSPASISRKTNKSSEKSAEEQLHYPQVPTRNVIIPYALSETPSEAVEATTTTKVGVKNNKNPVLG